MSGYVEAGYIVVLGSLLTYSTTLIARERRIRRRLGATGSSTEVPRPSADDDPSGS